MIKVDGYFLYQLGTEIHPLTTVSTSTTKGALVSIVWSVERWLDALLNHSVFGLRLSWQSGTTLLATVRRVKDAYSKDGVKWEDTIEWSDQYTLSSEAKTFETVLAAELQSGQIYLVQPKGGYDLAQLTENGIVIFPSSLPTKVPGAIKDAIEAARCIAFALPTAAAFHLHRLNEMVLRRYYDTVTQGKPHPEKATISKYIDAMKGYQVGDKVAFGALSSLNNLHRNPVLHPEQTLDSVEQAIALLGSVNSVVTYMLSALPEPPLVLEMQNGKEERPAIESFEAKAS